MLLLEATPVFYVCRLCGYVHKGKPNGPCPACGAPATSFVPYAIGIEENRFKQLNFDIHPILTHFGVGMAILLFLDFIVSLFAPKIFGINLSHGGVLDFFAILLPIFVGLTALAGVFDGKTRYKKLHTQYLMRKLWLAIVYFAVAIVIPFVNYGATTGNVAYVVIEFILIVVAVLLASMLGMIGKELMGHTVPRGHELKETKATEPASDEQGTDA